MNALLSPSHPHRPALGLDAVRVGAALIMLAHGLMRLYLHGVPVFGGWLSSQGLPAGTALAAAVTGFELAGALALLTRRAVVPASLGFMGILSAGIAMVHAREGWFVVGAGRNGAEFSALLITCFGALAWAHWPRRA